MQGFNTTMNVGVVIQDTTDIEDLRDVDTVALVTVIKAVEEIGTIPSMK